MSVPQPRIPSRTLAQWVNTVLLGVIAVSLVVIVVLLLDKGGGTNGNAETSNEPVVQDGQTVKRTEVDNPPPPPKTVGRPKRIREVLIEGAEYEVTAQFSLTAPVLSREWGIEQSAYLNYLAELQYTRRIEKNDGQRVQELRHFKHCRMIKVESTVDVRITWGAPAQLVLVGLDLLGVTGGTGSAIAVGIEEFRKAVQGYLESRLNDQNAKVKAMVDGLEGKQVRVVYEDGEGIVELTPIGCDLTAEERDFLMGVCSTSDAYLLPDIDSKPGDSWEVPAEAFGDFLPPSWRARPTGKVIVQRVQDFERNGQKFARLEIQQGSFEVDATDQSRTRIGSFTPLGWLEYNITDGHVADAALSGSATTVEASRDHLLFETRYETQPRFRAQYMCRILSRPAK